MKKPMHIGVSGGAGQIGYAILTRIAAGEMLGPDQPVVLHILEVPGALDALKGVVMELNDCAFPLLQGIHIGSDPIQVFEQVDIALLIGAKPRSKGMERADLLQGNAKIFQHQAKGLNRPNVKVVVVGNPANTNAYVLAHNAKDLPRENIRSMMRLDQNRAISALAEKAGVLVSDVKQVAIYGNHSPTMVPDYNNAMIGGKGAEEVINDLGWLQDEFMKTVQQRGAAIIEARGASSAASAANAAIMTVRDWIFPTEKDDWFTAGIYSTGNPYGIADDLYFSFPMRDQKIVAGLKVDPFIEQKIKATEAELIQERDAVRSVLPGV